MDAFYAAVEVRDDPGLRGLPVVVGGSPDGRGVVAAASYEARKFGIHSAMPARTAHRLCPDLVFVRARHDYYSAVSQQIRAVLERYTPEIEPLALDEAFMDLTQSLRLLGDGKKIAVDIKNTIKKELELVASVGVAPNKFLAKLASDLEKPDGLVVVDPDRVQPFLDPLPVTRIWGVGRSGARALGELKIETIAQLRAYERQALKMRFGEWGEHIWKLAHGIDDRPVVTDRVAKSISHETTFSEDVSDRAVLHSVLQELLEQVLLRLRRQNKRARTLQLKLRFADFTTITRALSLHQDTDLTREFAAAAAKLLDKALPQAETAIRLIGIGVSGLNSEPAEQIDLFLEQDRKQDRHLDSIADRINTRYGRGTIQRARSVRAQNKH